jgi:fructokinase
MVYTLGESLIDIIISSPEEVALRPGGGMLNVAVSLGRCGTEVALISETGDDQAARIIIDFLEENQVNSRYIKKYFRQNTSVALAFLDEEKVPTYSIHKAYPESRRLLAPEKFNDEDFLFFGSLYSLSAAIREPLREVLIRARESGSFLCYDPNIRSHDLNDPDIRQALNENIRLSHLIKASEEDLENIFGKRSIEEFQKELRRINPEAIIIITMGPKGAKGYWDGHEIDIPAPKIEVVSTIGAGDSFSAGLVFALTKWFGKEDQNEVLLRKIMESGIAFSSTVVASMDNYVGKDFKP